MDQVVGRSKLVAPVAALVTAHGLVVAYQGISAALSSTDSAALAVLDGTFAAVLLFLAYSIWSGEHWAWPTALIIEGINVLFSGLTLAFVPHATMAWMTGAIGVGLVILLAGPAIQARFSTRESANIVSLDEAPQQGLSPLSRR